MAQMHMMQGSINSQIFDLNNSSSGVTKYVATPYLRLYGWNKEFGLRVGGSDLIGVQN